MIWYFRVLQTSEESIKNDIFSFIKYSCCNNGCNKGSLSYWTRLADTNITIPFSMSYFLVFLHSRSKIVCRQITAINKFQSFKNMIGIFGFGGCTSRSLHNYWVNTLNCTNPRNMADNFSPWVSQLIRICCLIVNLLFDRDLIYLD